MLQFASLSVKNRLDRGATGSDVRVQPPGLEADRKPMGILTMG
jgi:hypothetical protein